MVVGNVKVTCENYDEEVGLKPAGTLITPCHALKGVAIRKKVQMMRNNKEPETPEGERLFKMK